MLESEPICNILSKLSFLERCEEEDLILDLLALFCCIPAPIKSLWHNMKPRKRFAAGSKSVISWELQRHYFTAILSSQTPFSPLTLHIHARPEWLKAVQAYSWSRLGTREQENLCGAACQAIFRPYLNKAQQPPHSPWTCSIFRASRFTGNGSFFWHNWTQVQLIRNG